MQTARLYEIYIIEEKGQPGRKKDCAKVKAYGGIIGDRHCDDSQKPISLLAKGTVEWMKAQSVKGLCFRRFKANLVYEGELEPEVGMKLQCGETVLEITGGKGRCFPECERYSRGLPCALPNGLWFARTVTGGAIKTGDTIAVM